MTRIFLRRGTSSDLSTVVLATGEAAYATDTKVLKIGDGSTSFASLSGLTGGSAGGVSAFTFFGVAIGPAVFSGVLEFSGDYTAPLLILGIAALGPAILLMLKSPEKP